MIQFVVNLHMLHAENKPTHGISTPAWRVFGSFSTLLTILERHEWQKQQASVGALDHTAWMFFSGCDVEDSTLRCGHCLMIWRSCVAKWLLRRANAQRHLISSSDGA